MNIEEIDKMPFGEVKRVVEEMNQEIIVLRDKCKRQERALKSIIMTISQLGQDRMDDIVGAGCEAMTVKSTRGRKPKQKEEPILKEPNLL